MSNHNFAFFSRSKFFLYFASKQDLFDFFHVTSCVTSCQAALQKSDRHAIKVRFSLRFCLVVKFGVDGCVTHLV